MKEGYVQCPECGVEVKEENLKSHLERVHGIVEEEKEGKSPTLKLLTVVIAAILVISFGIYFTIGHNSNDGDIKTPRLYGGDNTLRTNDGWEIVATYHEGNRSTVIVFIHGMKENRHVWDGEVAYFNSLGFSTLAIDLRGHGDSIIHNGQVETVESFTEDEFPSMIRDVRVYCDALISMGYNHIIFVGASIGANLAFIASTIYSQTSRSVLLSPGMDYHGISISEFIGEQHGPVFAAATEGDTYSSQAVHTLEGEIKGQGSEFHIYSGSNHGTHLLEIEECQKAYRQWITG